MHLGCLFHQVEYRVPFSSASTGIEVDSTQKRRDMKTIGKKSVGTLLFLLFLSPSLSSALMCSFRHLYACAVHWSEVGHSVPFHSVQPFLLRSSRFRVCDISLWLYYCPIICSCGSFRCGQISHPVSILRVLHNSVLLVLYTDWLDGSGSPSCCHLPSIPPVEPYLGAYIRV